MPFQPLSADDILPLRQPLITFLCYNLIRPLDIFDAWQSKGNKLYAICFTSRTEVTTIVSRSWAAIQSWSYRLILVNRSTIYTLFTQSYARYFIQSFLQTHSYVSVMFRQSHAISHLHNAPVQLHCSLTPLQPLLRIYFTQFYVLYPGSIRNYC